MRIRSALIALSLPLALGACATTGSPSDVDVTRFVEPAATARLGSGAVFVEAAPGSPDGLAMSPYLGAVADALRRVGYAESTRGQADQVVEVRIDRSQIDSQGRRSPVSVGVGGSTGSFGSGLGLGLGLNLGGGGGGPRIATQLGVMIRDRATNAVLWEGRADFDAPAASRYATPAGSATVLADAIFRGFPGNNGETITVEVPE